MSVLQTVFCVYGIMSALTFCVYGIDKFKAKRGMWRTPERTLHVLELCCGWPGALAAQRLFRHKSIKRSFRIVFWLMVLLNMSICIAVLAGGGFR